jgi:hypothetical protein
LEGPVIKNQMRDFALRELAARHFRSLHRAAAFFRGPEFNNSPKMAPTLPTTVVFP